MTDTFVNRKLASVAVNRLEKGDVMAGGEIVLALERIVGIEGVRIVLGTFNAVNSTVTVGHQFYDNEADTVTIRMVASDRREARA